METIRYDVVAAIRFNADAEKAIAHAPHVFAAFSTPVYLPPHFGTAHVRETQGLRHRMGML